MKVEIGVEWWKAMVDGTVANSGFDSVKVKHELVFGCWKLVIVLGDWCLISVTLQCRLRMVLCVSWDGGSNG
ncbi:hypothetical protein LR48_Vigan583s003300 [Vigna angularis]|uniref:Uncharacterized protein n=1 Tax=Phaseolus angularis TaxID=3914 RepID=A0A0L9TE27_PHAAN|nr:hypothetical protein LR48_Vigan583s003300 [Vigna angularis]